MHCRFNAEDEVQHTFCYAFYPSTPSDPVSRDTVQAHQPRLQSAARSVPANKLRAVLDMSIPDSESVQRLRLCAGGLLLVVISTHVCELQNVLAKGTSQSGPHPYTEHVQDIAGSSTMNKTPGLVPNTSVRRP